MSSVWEAYCTKYDAYERYYKSIKEHIPVYHSYMPCIPENKIIIWVHDYHYVKYKDYIASLSSDAITLEVRILPDHNALAI